LLGFIKRTLGLGFHIISESENHQFQFFEKKLEKQTILVFAVCPNIGKFP
jgi:hypothetical protein